MAKNGFQGEEIYGNLVGNQVAIEAEIVRLAKKDSVMRDEAKAAAASYRDVRKDTRERIDYLLGIHGMKKQEAA
jgi:hypothetical protein